jgi:excisionase family DNA binding protein
VANEHPRGSARARIPVGEHVKTKLLDLIAKLAPSALPLIRHVLRAEIRAALAEIIQSSTAPPAQPEPWLTILEAAKFAHVHPCTIREWIKDGSLKASRVGRVYRIRREDLDGRIGKVATNMATPAAERFAEDYLAKQRAKIVRR